MPTLVALLAEGVDRNAAGPQFGDIVVDVALLAEGVDRNWDCYEVLADDPVGRPPRGGRG